MKKKKERFNFDKSLKMHMACYSCDLRPAMQCIYFKNGFAYASDGLILVKNRISECSTLDEATIQALDGKLLHKDFYRDIIKYDSIMVSEDGIECSMGNDKAFFYFVTDENIKYPDAEKTLQGYLNKDNHPVSQIVLKIQLLERIRKSLWGADLCQTNFKDCNSAIIQSTECEVSSVGIIMLQQLSD